MADKSEDKPVKKTMKQMLEEKAKHQPHYQTLKNTVKGRKGIHNKKNPWDDHNKA
ncbi:hypothetical protein GCM10007939_21560 [Amylibacter marinus]|uniref:Uncharacterized protein n=1 Tax=Amylibacter marinus TaxID=1475483 RepID=A0ABQ5VX53_9RHOB|nr:hypothetical protein [Amylibacter marinus]GLQ35872.1 hypothetical protein GCM10007939_21560 [Amylibacter marinus]